MLVRCLNCELLWRRITEISNPGGTVAFVDIQKVCPNCNSNAYVVEADQASEGRQEPAIPHIPSEDEKPGYKYQYRRGG